MCFKSCCSFRNWYCILRYWSPFLQERNQRLILMNGVLTDLIIYFQPLIINITKREPTPFSDILDVTFMSKKKNKLKFYATSAFHCFLSLYELNYKEEIILTLHLALHTKYINTIMLERLTAWQFWCSYIIFPMHFYNV